jgi:O-antigen/teichoic acid export membrane protein
MHGIGHIPATVLLGRGQPDRVAKLYLFYLAPYFAALLLLMHEFGLEGAAIAWSTRACMDFSLFWFVRTGRREAAQGVGCAALVLLSTLAALRFDWHAPMFWLVLVSLSLASVALAYTIVPRTVWDRVQQLLRLPNVGLQGGDGGW